MCTALYFQQLKERIQQRKNRYQDAATMLLGMGERQKTMVAKSQKVNTDTPVAKCDLLVLTGNYLKFLFILSNLDQVSLLCISEYTTQNTKLA